MSFSRQALRSCRNSSFKPYVRPTSYASFGTSCPARSAISDQGPAPSEEQLPRWAQTPPEMKGHVKLNTAKDPRRQVWAVNEDPEKLDRVLERLLGRETTRLLPEETKWLAVTHKSFDYGRRGFNTRLAFYGRQIVALETMRSVMLSPAVSGDERPDPFGREPFQHPSLRNVDKLGVHDPREITAPERIAKIATEAGLKEIVRWKPRLPENLDASGLDVVLTTTLYAIVGAVSLNQGADVASRLVQDRILRRRRD